MSRLEGLYEWSFNDGRVLGFLYISIVRQMILKSLILKHFFSIFMMDGPIKTMAQNAWHTVGGFHEHTVCWLLGIYCLTFVQNFSYTIW